jgi:hypothetical protein
MLIYSAYFLYELLNNQHHLFINEDYRFWMVLAIMIYLSGSFFIYLLANQIPNAQLKRYWMFTDVFYTLKNLFFLIGIIVLLTRPKKKEIPKVPSPKPYSETT